MKIRAGDTVKIVCGKDRGKSGKVTRVFREAERVLVEGMNRYKKHVRPRRQGEKGEVVDVSRPLAVSNVQLLCPHCDAGIRVGFRFENETKIRICKKCKSRLS